MPSEQAKRNKAAYDTRYMKEHRILKTIAFNNAIPEDMKLLDWVEQQPNQTQYVKDLIRDDMEDKVGN